MDFGNYFVPIPQSMNMLKEHSESGFNADNFINAP